MVSNLDQFEKVLQTTKCVAANVFTNEGHLQPTASQRAWSSAVIQVFHRIKGFALEGTRTRQEDLKIFNYLLPPERVCFLPEDQEQLISSLPPKTDFFYQLLYSSDSSLILHKFNTDCSLEIKKNILDFAFQFDNCTLILQWKEQSGIDFTENQLQKFLGRTIFYQEVELLKKIFDKESTAREENALKEMLKTHFPMENKKQAIVYKAMGSKYERLSIILLTYFELAQPVLNELLKIASALELDLVVKHLLSNPCNRRARARREFPIYCCPR